MKPVLNKVPKSPIFLCEEKRNGECYHICFAGADTPHKHEYIDEGYIFFCDQMHHDVRCVEVE